MQITTKFNVGDSVVFLHNNAFTRREIAKIDIEVAAYLPTPATALITYYFKNLPPNQYHAEVYKYESEVALSKEDLTAMMQEF